MGRRTSEESGSQVDRFELRFRAAPENLRRVRRALEGMGLPDQVIWDGTLLTTELVTNSIRHAGLGPDDYIDVGRLTP
jgi:anti-sigma regulatory factor (Ser/Thr protein kinase)